jgi:hypothetical protein
MIDDGDPLIEKPFDEVGILEIVHETIAAGTRGGP